MTSGSRSWREIRPEVVTDEAQVAAHRARLEELVRQGVEQSEAGHVGRDRGSFAHHIDDEEQQ